MKLNKIDARICYLCKTPKRPLELLKHLGSEYSFSYINQRLSVLATLGYLIRRSIRERGKNASWYTLNSQYLKEVEDTLRESSDEDSSEISSKLKSVSDEDNK